MTTATPDKWLSLKEAAEYLGVGKSTMYLWVQTNKIPAHKFGRLWKFKTSEIDEWMANQ